MLAPAADDDHAPDASDALGRALERFGHDGLRIGQAEVIADVFAGRPVVAVMPTGAGKSLCYQLPAVVLGDQGGVTLVVSPLIALMKDQVDALRARGVPAAALTSAANPEEQREIIDGMRAGMYTLVYVAPERFRSPRFVDALRAVAGKLALVAIDEAHCISEWGHDFRPDYRRLGGVITSLRPPRLAAFTATATPEVRLDIAAQLRMAEPRIHVRGFDRPNLSYSVVQVGGAADKADKLVELVRTRDGGVALVYAATRKNAEKYAADLKQAGMRSRVYHAGLDDRVRERAQDTFMAGQLDVIVATNAFGMGVDKSDIRLVVHADIPRSPEAYYQEAGRGGRDGKATRCVLLFNHGDIRLQEFLIDASFPSAEMMRALWKKLKDQPKTGRPEDIEDRLRRLLPGDPPAAAIGSALRILERHGLLAIDGSTGSYVAVRPEPGLYPALDVEGLQRRSDVERGKLKTMIEYAYWPRCRRQFVLEYFGDEEWRDRGRKCGACDNCDALAHGHAKTLSDNDKRIVRILLMLVVSLDGRFGRTKLSALAIGDDDTDRFADLPARGCLRGYTQKQVLDLLRSLEGAGLIEASRGQYPTISVTKRGVQVAGERLEIDGLGIQMPVVKVKRPGSASRRRRT
jgi:ATP-dependent DNA helicase RecQ